MENLVISQASLTWRPKNVNLLTIVCARVCVTLWRVFTFDSAKHRNSQGDQFGGGASTHWLKEDFNGQKYMARRKPSATAPTKLEYKN